MQRFFLPILLLLFLGACSRDQSGAVKDSSIPPSHRPSLLDPTSKEAELFEELVLSGNAEHLEAFIATARKKYDINRIHPKSNYALIHKIILKGQLKTLNVIIEYGANINLRDRISGEVPLMLIDNQDNALKMLKVLVQNDNIKLAITDFMGRNILHHLSSRGDAQILEKLIEYSSTKNNHHKILHNLVHAKDLANATPLHLLMDSTLDKDQWIRFFKLLQYSSPPYHALDAKKRTPLAKAIQLKLDQRILKELWEAMTREKKQMALSTFNLSGDNTLMLAIKHSLPNQILLSMVDLMGIDELNLTDTKGASPLMLAVKMSNVELVEKLLEKQVSPNLQDKYGKTALSYARQIEHPYLIDLILNHLQP